jgi:hypothetical protein
MGFEKFARDLAARERARLEAFYAMWGEPLDGEWAVIATECDLRNALDNDCCPLDLADGQTLDQHLARRQEEKRRRSSQQTPQSTSNGSGRVDLPEWDDDPLRRIPAKEYLPVIADVEVSATGTCRCPLPDHEDRHPSAKTYGARWHCFGCNRRGGIIDVAAAVYGVEPTGADYWRLRDMILDALEPGVMR